MVDNRHDSMGANTIENLNSYDLSEKPQSGNDQEEPFPKAFDPAGQTRRLFREQGFRLFTTCVFAAIFVATLKICEKQGSIDNMAMRLFNSIMMCLTLILGLNFFEAFKDMAKVLRWQVLACRPHSVREVDLILGAYSLQTLFTLMWESRKKYLTVLVCMIWILLNIIAQALIGMMGLAYSMESGTDSTGIIKRQGLVNVPQLDYHYFDGPRRGVGNYSVPQYLANAYGEAIHCRQSCNYTQDSDIQNASQDCYYFSHTNGQEFAYRYAQYNPKDSARAYPYLTDRIVKASASECFQYKVINAPDKVDSQDGIQDTLLWHFYNSTFNGTISIPQRDATYDSTTYIYNGTDVPPHEEFQSCGNRCIRLYAWRSPGPVRERPLTVFQCSITVGEVNNVVKDWQRLPDNLSYYAAASIALSGIHTQDLHWRQFRLYPYNSYWEAGNLSASGVGARMSEFAIGSLATMVNLNPSQQVEDTVPVLGYQLSVEWRYVIPLIAIIAIVHFILVGLMLWIARSVVVLDASNLCMARLLEGLTRDLNGRGSLLNGREIAKAIETQGTGEVRLVYGFEENNAERILRLGDEKEILRGLKSG